MTVTSVGMSHDMNLARRTISRVAEVSSQSSGVLLSKKKPSKTVYRKKNTRRRGGFRFEVLSLEKTLEELSIRQAADGLQVIDDAQHDLLQESGGVHAPVLLNDFVEFSGECVVERIR